MIRQAISCDVCGTEKRQTKHWYVAFKQGDELRLGGWSAHNRARPGSKHLCGQTCVHKLVDEYMALTLASRPEQVAEDVAAEIAGQYAAQSAGQWKTSIEPTENESHFDGVASKAPVRAVELQAAKGEDKKGKSKKAGLAPVEEVLPIPDLHVSELPEEEESSARVVLTLPEPSGQPMLVRVAVERPTPIAIHSSASTGGGKNAAVVPSKTILELPLAEEQPGYSSRTWRAEAWERERAREQRAANGKPDQTSRMRTN